MEHQAMTIEVLMMDDKVLSTYLNKLKKFVELQTSIMHFHHVLNEFYPIAIIEAEELFVFDYDSQLHEYKLMKIEPNVFGIQQGVRAAFPLDCYYNKPSVVVSGEVFDSLAEQITIFHENVHCYQLHTCEQELRSELELAQKTVNTKEYYWELHYPFPYDDERMVSLFDKAWNFF